MLAKNLTEQIFWIFWFYFCI